MKDQSWSGALQTLDAIEETTLNDIIWFDTDYIEEALNVKLWGEDND